MWVASTDTDWFVNEPVHMVLKVQTINAGVEVALMNTRHHDLPATSIEFFTFHDYFLLFSHITTVIVFSALSADKTQETNRRLKESCANAEDWSCFCFPNASVKTWWKVSKCTRYWKRYEDQNSDT